MRVVITVRPRSSQIKATLALLQGAVALRGRLEVASGGLSRENATAWVNDRLRGIENALRGDAVSEPLARMVAAALTTAGVTAQVSL